MKTLCPPMRDWMPRLKMLLTYHAKTKNLPCDLRKKSPAKRRRRTTAFFEMP